MLGVPLPRPADHFIRMTSDLPFPVSGRPAGTMCNGGKRRYLVEAQSTTGYVAWRTAGGVVLVGNAQQVSIAASAHLTFWSCAGYQDTSHAGHITSLDCHDNGLTSLDIHRLTELEYLDCSFNKLREVDLTGLAGLQALDADHNHLIRLEVQCLRTLRMLNCARNRLAALDVTGLGALEVLDCSHNRLNTLDLGDCRSLKDCKTDGNPNLRA